MWGGDRYNPSRSKAGGGGAIQWQAVTKTNVGSRAKVFKWPSRIPLTLRVLKLVFLFIMHSAQSLLREANVVNRYSLRSL